MVEEHSSRYATWWWAALASLLAIGPMVSGCTGLATGVRPSGDVRGDVRGDVGVATRAEGRAGARGAAQGEVRESVTVRDSAPRLVLAGPGRLLHVDVDDRGRVTIFRVPRRSGAAIDCGSQPPRPDAVIEMKHASLDVQRDESICLVAVRPTTRARVSVSWHGQHAAERESPPLPVRHASLP